MPGRPVVAVSGDGSAMYSIQSLWSAAHHKLAIVFVVLANRQYRILDVKANVAPAKAKASVAAPGQWGKLVRRGRFGGDPSRVMVHGQSGGGRKTSMVLSTLPATANVLAGAIVAHSRISTDELACARYVLRDDRAVAQLFRVASSLDSMVVGEGQILGQVRAALKTAGCEPRKP